MSDYIVLVKQVPDVSQITDNAFDPVSGTLIRARLASVINELDAQALAFADHMKKISHDRNGRIVVLTMGPPMAEEVLRYSLSRCADEVVLLTDRALGGADTVATANPLAFTIRKIATEILKNDKDYYIVCGMQSVDGDTAQVPPQMAEELSLPCIGYVTNAEFKNERFEFTRIISGGSQTVAAKTPPIVVTVAKYEYPLFATFARTRWANQTQVTTWSSEDIHAPHIGVKGSKTSVIRVFPPAKSTRKCRQLSDVQYLARALTECVKHGNGDTTETAQTPASRYILPNRRASLFERGFEGTEREQGDYKFLSDLLHQSGIQKADQINDEMKQKILGMEGGRFHPRTLEDMIHGLTLTEPTFKGEVWVVAEHSNGAVHPSTFELTGKARELADSLETDVGVCLAGHGVQPMTKELIEAGADIVYSIEDMLLERFDPTAYRKAIADAISTHWPQIVLFAATPQGRMLAPMISYRVGCGLTADCTSLDIRDSSRKGDIGLLLQTDLR